MKKKTLSTAAERGEAILAMMPDDPVKATAELLTFAASACITAGFDDEKAIRGLRTSLASLREQGFGEERH